MARVVKEARPKMHGTRSEQRLMSGLGKLIRQDASKVPVTGDKPGGRQRRKP